MEEKVFVVFTEDMLDGDEDQRTSVHKTLEGAKAALKRFHDTTMEDIISNDPELENYVVDEFTDETTAWQAYLDGAWYEDHSLGFIEEKVIEE